VGYPAYAMPPPVGETSGVVPPFLNPSHALAAGHPQHGFNGMAPAGKLIFLAGDRVRICGSWRRVAWRRRGCCRLQNVAWRRRLAVDVCMDICCRLQNCLVVFSLCRLWCSLSFVGIVFGFAMCVLSCGFVFCFLSCGFFFCFLVFVVVGWWED